MRVRGIWPCLTDQKHAYGLPGKFFPESNINQEYNTAVKSPLYHRYQK
ncbi:MAG: hypothetical protein ABF293_03880 [Flavobacteriaceae bacterium]